MINRDTILVYTSGILVVLVLAFAGYDDASPGYKKYQDEFRTLVSQKFGPEMAAFVPSGVQQIWIESANRVDRCTSCHLGVTWEGLENEKQPFATHPKEPLEKHPIEKFGCTLCHGGQGFAATLPEAHGWVKHWEEPLLDSKLEEEYQLGKKGGFKEMRCNSCHRYDRETEGADYINRAKALVNEKGCRACHTINGRGGNIGPDLTEIGAKTSEQYDYSRLTTFPSVFNWQAAHLQNPKSFAPDTVMPEFGFNSEDAKALTLLLLSWRKHEIPMELLPPGAFGDMPTPEELERDRIMLEGEGRFFVEKTCFVCHDVSSLGIVSATKIGPDLAIAVDDVQRRFGRTLDDFLHNPSGTMSVVLSRQIHLTEEEIDEAVRLLEHAYEVHKSLVVTKGKSGESSQSSAGHSSAAQSH